MFHIFTRLITYGNLNSQVKLLSWSFCTDRNTVDLSWQYCIVWRGHFTCCWWKESIGTYLWHSRWHLFKLFHELTFEPGNIALFDPYRFYPAEKTRIFIITASTIQKESFNHVSQVCFCWRSLRLFLFHPSLIFYFIPLAKLLIATQYVDQIKKVASGRPFILVGTHVDVRQKKLLEFQEGQTATAPSVVTPEEVTLLFSFGFALSLTNFFQGKQIAKKVGAKLYLECCSFSSKLFDLKLLLTQGNLITFQNVQEKLRKFSKRLCVLPSRKRSHHLIQWSMGTNTVAIFSKDSCSAINNCFHPHAFHCRRRLLSRNNLWSVLEQILLVDYSNYFIVYCTVFCLDFHCVWIRNLFASNNHRMRKIHEFAF